VSDHGLTPRELRQSPSGLVVLVVVVSECRVEGDAVELLGDGASDCGVIGCRPGRGPAQVGRTLRRAMPAGERAEAILQQTPAARTSKPISTTIPS